MNWQNEIQLLGTTQFYVSYYCCWFFFLKKIKQKPIHFTKGKGFCIACVRLQPLSFDALVALPTIQVCFNFISFFHNLIRIKKILFVIEREILHCARRIIRIISNAFKSRKNEIGTNKRVGKWYGCLCQ